MSHRSGAKGVMFRRLKGRVANYPHKDLTDKAKRLILKAVVRAWKLLLAENTAYADENELTVVLVDGLNQIWANGGIFQTVQRDGCSVSYNAERLHKRPDFLVRLATAKGAYEGWFVECKIVDATHRPALYYEKGVTRFIDGDYAWAMPSALMIGYAGPGYRLARVPQLQDAAASAFTNAGAELYDTTHMRPWTYPDGVRKPGDITLTHCWLQGARLA